MISISKCVAKLRQELFSSKCQLFSLETTVLELQVISVIVTATLSKILKVTISPNRCYGITRVISLQLLVGYFGVVAIINTYFRFYCVSTSPVNTKL